MTTSNYMLDSNAVKKGNSKNDRWAKDLLWPEPTKCWGKSDDISIDAVFVAVVGLVRFSAVFVVILLVSKHLLLQIIISGYFNAKI